MNNEMFDDKTQSDSKLTTDDKKFTGSWKLPTECAEVDVKPAKVENKFSEALEKTCRMFFQQKTSYFATCFSMVDPTPFYEICINLGSLPRYSTSVESSEKAACTSGIAYIDACSDQNVPLRVPDTCIQ